MPAVIVLGRDDADRPHASWFTADEAPLATRAAGLREMVTLQVEGAVLARIAANLPHGRVFASGKAFVPFVRGAVYDDLVAHLPEGVEAPSRTSGNRPVAAPDDAAKPVRKKPAEAASASGSGEGKGGLQPGATDAVALPKDWKEIAPGCLVLASIDRADGWWPAIITEDKGDGLFVLQWQDYSDWEPFIRKREQLALLHPSYTAS